MNPDVSLTAALGLGFVLGIRHAMDADHLAAVSTLVSQHRSVARACLLGAFWGVIYLRRRSAVAPMVSHAGFNLLQVLLFVVSRRSV